MSWDEFVRRELGELRARGLLRSLRAVEGAQGRIVRVDGRPVVNFASNDYLGLASHRALARAAARAVDEGTGAGASRLIVGNLAGHRALERQLARHFERPAALLFNSGYNANVGALQALAGRDDVVFSDELNHASIIDGCRLSRARVRVYGHGDVDALREGLRANAGSRKLIVSDGLFSMDGDVAPVAALAALAREHDALLVVDEAHAVGALGPGGRGVCARAGVTPDVLVGTFGKAYGSFGAFAATTEAVRDWLVNRARSFVFTTGLPPTVVAASSAALELSAGAEGDRLRGRLARNAARLADHLGSVGILTQVGETTHILPVRASSDEAAMECAERLLAAGMYAQGIRPPTVPVGTSRVRVAVMATHEDGDIDALALQLEQLAAAGKLKRA